MEAFKEEPRLAQQTKCRMVKHTVPSVCTNDSVSKPLGEVSAQTNSVIKVQMFFVNLLARATNFHHSQFLQNILQLTNRNGVQITLRKRIQFMHLKCSARERKVSCINAIKAAQKDAIMLMMLLLDVLIKNLDLFLLKAKRNLSHIRKSLLQRKNQNPKKKQYYKRNHIQKKNQLQRRNNHLIRNLPPKRINPL